MLFGSFYFIEFEGREIDFLVRKDTFNSTGQNQEEAVRHMKQDEYVLQKLFAKTGIVSSSI